METPEIEMLLETATKGPWGTKGVKNVFWTVDTDGENSCVNIGPKKKLPVCIAVVNAAWVKDHILDANAALIAAAPDLAAEVLRLRAENAQLLAANQALVARDAEARALIEHAVRYLGPSRAATAFLAGKAGA